MGRTHADEARWLAAGTKEHMRTYTIAKARLSIGLECATVRL